MQMVLKMAGVLAVMPHDSLVAGLALAAMALSAFAIYVVHSIARERLRK
jgi:hypothetical protein